MSADKKVPITIEGVINAPLKTVWKYWTSPSAIIHWNNASPDWCTPRAENDLRPGGRFTYRMEARDGSAGFDFWGNYTEVVLYERIAYIMGDGRTAGVLFLAEEGRTRVVETFEPEGINPLEMQRQGWQAILDNFKRYVEASLQEEKVMIKHPITPCLWFDHQAEEAARFYTAIFPNSSIGAISRYTREGHEIHGQEAGTVLTVEFKLDGHSFTAMNGGPLFKFTEAVSFQVFCDTQEEIDYYWSRLTEGGEESQCGWLKDKFGLSWQVVPAILPQLISDPQRAERVMKVLMPMKKLEIDKLVGA